MKRVLFFAEAVTLAHVARPAVLAGSLDLRLYEVVVACSPTHQHFFGDAPFRRAPLVSISSERFVDALASGRPLYDAETLRDYVKDDLATIERFKPDLVVGDFRLSLSVSCRLAQIPYGTVTNAYWSPYLLNRHYPLPVLPLTRLLPIPVARVVFDRVRPLAFALHCRALNQVRGEHGLDSLGNDLRRAYTDADHALYADPPGLFPLSPLPDHHVHLGPLLWSPPLELPAWWADVPTDRPALYLTLGSSGGAAALRQAVRAVSGMPVSVMVATAGAEISIPPSGNIYTARYLPGLEAARRAQVVVCNGGSPTSHQALAAGVPVIGIASNMDQFLNMSAIAEAGAGTLLRADRLSDRDIRAAVEHAWPGTPMANSAAKLFGDGVAAMATQRFGQWVEKALAAEE